MDIVGEGLFLMDQCALTRTVGPMLEGG
jgi:hypothetical protein